MVKFSKMDCRYLFLGLVTRVPQNFETFRLIFWDRYKNVGLNILSNFNYLPFHLQIRPKSLGQSLVIWLIYLHIPPTSGFPLWIESNVVIDCICWREYQLVISWAASIQFTQNWHTKQILALHNTTEQYCIFVTIDIRINQK